AGTRRTRRTLRALLHPAHDRVAVEPPADARTRSPRPQPRGGTRLLAARGTGRAATLRPTRGNGVLVGGSRLPRRARRTVDRGGAGGRARRADPAASIVSRRRGACRRR